MDRSDVCEGVVTGGKRGTWGSSVRSLSSFSILTWATLLCGAFPHTHTTNVLAQVWKQCVKSCILNTLKPWARLNIYPFKKSFQVHCTKTPQSQKIPTWMLKLDILSLTILMQLCFIVFDSNTSNKEIFSKENFPTIYLLIF